MFDMFFLYCENLINIPLSIAMLHGIIENWRKNKMTF